MTTRPAIRAASRATLLFLFSTAAVNAAEFCHPLAELHSHIFFCDQNQSYVNFASACREEFRALVEAKKAELLKTLNSGIAGAASRAQNFEFKTTKTSYESTDKTLAVSIQVGKQARGEVVEYGDDFLAPFSWPWIDLGPWPGLHHPEVQELFRSAPCYKDNIEQIEKITADFDLMIKQLEDTRAKAAQLHAAASKSEGKLDDLSSLVANVSGGLSAIPAGKSQNLANDITGLKEDDAKRSSLASASSTAKLAKPKADTKAAVTEESAVTKSAARDTSRVTADAAASLFNKKILDRGSVPPQLAKAGGKAAEPASVGAAIWAEDEKSKSGLELGLAPEPNKSGLEASAGREKAAGAGQPSEDAASASLPGSQPSEELRAKGLLKVEGAERNIFTLVHERYRASELFRSH